MSIKTWSKWHDAAKKEFHRGMLKVLSKFHIIIRPEILTKNFKLFFKTLCITLRSVMKVPPKLFQFVFTCSNSKMHNVNQNNVRNPFKVTNNETKRC